MTTIKISKSLIPAISLVFLLIAIAFLIRPYLANAEQKIRGFNLYKMAYSSTFTALTTLTPPGEQVSKIKVESTVEESSDYLAKISFAETSEEQKKFESNEFAETSNLEKLKTKLRIPSLNIDGPVVDGQNEAALERGFWFIPISAKPGEKGNTVILGHRFLKLPPAKDTLFYLDRVNIGNHIEIEQGGSVLSYTIVQKKIITPYQRDVIYPTNDYRLTIITCTPLWENTHRLVVTAILDEVEQGI